jgi:putative redox protein
MRRLQVATSSSPETAHVLTVVWAGGNRHRVAVRGHHLLVDQPCGDGGQDAGPTPVELFIASLASCIGHYARRGLGPSGGGPEVRCTWTMSAVAPWRVTRIDVHVRLPDGTSPARLAAVERAIAHCTVHNTLLDLPVIRITAETPALALAGSKLVPTCSPDVNRLRPSNRMRQSHRSRQPHPSTARGHLPGESAM